MEKSIYFLQKPTTVSIEAFRDTLLNEVVLRLQSLGASQLTVNVADINASIQEQAPGRLIGPCQPPCHFGMTAWISARLLRRV